MAQLALKSGGRHSFIEDATQLAQIFNEDFGEMLSVVALEVEITVDCKPGVRPVRLLGREGDISGQKVVTTMNQIYSKQAQYVLLEVEVPATEEVNARDVATVSLAYLNLVPRHVTISAVPWRHDSASPPRSSPRTSTRT